MHPDLLIHALMRELRAIQLDAGALTDAAFANVGSNLLADGCCGEAIDLAGQVNALRLKIDRAIEALEPEAMEYICREIVNREHDKPGVH